jgi:hypothetical protein
MAWLASLQFREHVLDFVRNWGLCALESCFLSRSALLLLILLLLDLLLLFDYLLFLSLVLFLFPTFVSHCVTPFRLH